MQFPTLKLTARTTWRVAAASLTIALSCAAQHARAESAYVSQMPAQVVTKVPISALDPAGKTTRNYAPPRESLPYNASAPATQNGANYASTTQIGNFNSVLQLQNGANNASNVGVIGSYNNVAVLQSGNQLRSNVVLLNTVGMNVGVLQPNGSAPVNVLIARLPGGGLLIKR